MKRKEENERNDLDAGAGLLEEVFREMGRKKKRKIEKKNPFDCDGMMDWK